MPRRLLPWLCVLALLPLLPLPAPAVVAQADERCFPDTGFCVSGRIREVWEQNDGERAFGFPISAEQAEMVGTKTVPAQWFQRHRLERHADLTPPYDVQLGHLGRARLAMDGRSAASFPPSDPRPECRYFSETRHNVCDRFLAAWRASGVEMDGQPGLSEAENLALFGLPLGEMATEIVDGVSREVQWFERARFERHPGNEPPFDVQFGLLGREIRTAPPPPQPTPPASPTLVLPAPTPASPYDGAWYGSITRGTDLSFTVEQGVVTYLEIDIKPHRDCRIVTKIDYRAAGLTPPRIENGRLAIVAEGPEIVVRLNGNFSTAGRIDGDGDFKSTDSGCSSADRFFWHANKRPPEPVVEGIDGEWSGLTAKGEPISLTVAGRVITRVEIIFQKKDECTARITTPQPLTVNSFAFNFQTDLGVGYVNGRFTSSQEVEGFLKLTPAIQGCGQGSVDEWRWKARRQG